MDMKINFAGNNVVHAEIRGFTIATDAPTTPGGSVTAPSPVDLLLAALGNCTAYYVQHFCQQRDIPLDNISLSVNVTKDEEARKITAIEVAVNLPASFPEKYVDACLKACSQCTVKKYLLDPPMLSTVANYG